MEGSEHVRGERRVAASQAAMSGWATRRAPTGLAECRVRHAQRTGAG